MIGLSEKTEFEKTEFLSYLNKLLNKETISDQEKKALEVVKDLELTGGDNIRKARRKRKEIKQYITQGYSKGADLLGNFGYFLTNRVNLSEDQIKKEQANLVEMVKTLYKERRSNSISNVIRKKMYISAEQHEMHTVCERLTREETAAVELMQEIMQNSYNSAGQVAQAVLKVQGKLELNEYKREKVKPVKPPIPLQYKMRLELNSAKDDIFKIADIWMNYHKEKDPGCITELKKVKERFFQLASDESQRNKKDDFGCNIVNLMMRNLSKYVCAGLADALIDAGNLTARYDYSNYYRSMRDRLKEYMKEQKDKSAAEDKKIIIDFLNRRNPNKDQGLFKRMIVFIKER